MDSEWQWQPSSNLYYSQRRKLWAKWDADKNAWEYAVPVVAVKGEGQNRHNAGTVPKVDARPGSREPGELSDDEGDSHDVEYEWPGIDATEELLDEAVVARFAALPIPAYGDSSLHDLRLVLSSTTIPSLKQSVAVINPDEGTSIGRDVAPGSRLRLKEMAVSKFHSNLFWDNQLRGWAITDMGSLHGTFLKAVSTGSTTRLSPPRVASTPSSLKHLDELTIGSTSFIAHIHKDGMPCQECCLTEYNEISLHSEKKKVSPVGTGYVPPTPATERRDAVRKDIANLKKAMLSRSPGNHKAPTDVPYKDRSAYRRRHNPESLAQAATRISSPKPPPLLPTETTTVATPISSSSIGHALLEKQGWKPGMTLGTPESRALVEPLVAVSTAARAGLGMKRRLDDEAVGAPADWREQGKRKRYQTLAGGDG